MFLGAAAIAAVIAAAFESYFVDDYIGIAVSLITIPIAVVIVKRSQRNYFETNT